MSTLQRVQVILDSKQRLLLRKIARQEKRSMSAVLREIIDRGIAQREADAKQWKPALAQLKALREANQTEYVGNPVDDARAERERQVEEIWHRSS